MRTINKSTTLGIRLKPAEKKYIEFIACDDGIDNLSDWVRLVLSNYLEAREVQRQAA